MVLAELFINSAHRTPTTISMLHAWIRRSSETYRCEEFENRSPEPIMTTAAGLRSCSQSFLNMDQLTVDRIKLNAPSLARIANALRPELQKNFKHVSVEVVQCPDLTQSPFNLVSTGLSGNENVFDIGDIENLLPTMKREKLYNIKDLKRITASDPLFVIGACAGPHPFVGVDSESVVNMTFVGDRVENRSHIFTSTQASSDCIHSMLPDDETRFSFLANVFTSNGLTGEVLKIVCEVRTGQLNFTACIGKALLNHFGDEIVALGGVILMENGKVKLHIIKPDLVKTALMSYKELGKIFHYTEVTPPLLGVGCIVSRDPGLNLRLQHFHVNTDRGQGGHYHYDTEPDTIKYTAYFSVAKYLTKIDQTNERLQWEGIF